MPAPLTAGEILEETIEDGKEELGRGSAGLALSGFGAGLNISFSGVALAFAFALTYAELLPPTALSLLLEEIAHKMEYGFWTMVLKGVVGGWLVAFIVWLAAASRDTVSQIFFMWAPVFLIPVLGLVHCIAGSSEVLISVFADETAWIEFLGRFLLPATLGNTIGGVILVTLLNYGQVIGSKPKT